MDKVERIVFELKILNRFKTNLKSRPFFTGFGMMELNPFSKLGVNVNVDILENILLIIQCKNLLF